MQPTPGGAGNTDRQAVGCWIGIPLLRLGIDTLVVISEGETAPDFEIVGTDGEEFREYRLSDHTTAGAVVLVFYPFDFSPVCTKELCEIRDAGWLMSTEDVDVFGISRDSCYAHNRFMDEHNLSFPLLSDTTGTISDAYGVAYDEWEFHEGVPKRALITIDDADTVRYTWFTESAYESPTLEELHESVTTLTT